MHRAGSELSSTNAAPIDSSMVRALMQPAAFDRPTRSIELVETHISWVILTDDFAYKIKKPISLDFLDFGDLERRRFYCEQEVRLNRPWAPDIYLDVVAITESDGVVRFGGNGTVVEYAVRMRRFDEALRLDRQLESGNLTVDDMRELGGAIAARHAAAVVADPGRRERFVSTAIAFIRDNFAALEPAIESNTLRPLFDWTESELERNDGLFAKRFDEGFVRDCHGDLHLANIVRLPSGIATFDCIEFNDDLRIIDVVCDLAFLVMDLVARGELDLAAHALNRYLERSGDYGGVRLFDLYFVYRCLVRAKVAVILAEESGADDARRKNLGEARRYCGIALRQASKPAPMLIVMHGLSGSGKTWLSGRLMALLPAIRIRSDIERKRMFGIGEAASSESGIGTGIYSPEAGAAVYARLVDTGREILRAGHNVVLDAAFLDRRDREHAVAMADALGCAAVIVNVEAPAAVLRERIRRRQASSSDASEAGLGVLEGQLDATQGIADAERPYTLSFANSGRAGARDVAALVDAIREYRYTVQAGKTEDHDERRGDRSR